MQSRRGRGAPRKSRGGGGGTSRTAPPAGGGGARGGLMLSERVRHDSVSTVAFKFQAHHLFHIFKFDVQEFGLRTNDKFSEVLVEF